MTFVVNPNSPTGAWVSPESLNPYVAQQPGIVVVDEAYAPFTGTSMLHSIEEHPNEIVVRTFSKAYSLAGLRVGYAVGAEALISELMAAHLPYPTSSCAIAAACAALSETERHQDLISLVTAERARVTRALRDLGWAVPESRANFIFAAPPGGAANELYERLARRGIFVRYMPGIDLERLRISISEPAANDALLAAATDLTT